MALDLFANFERTANNTIFYRKCSAATPGGENALIDPHKWNFRVCDLSAQEADLSNDILVSYSIGWREDLAITENASTSALDWAPWPPDANGLFKKEYVWDTTLPCVCSISVKVTNLFTGAEDIHTLSGVFVPEKSWPKLDLIAWPSYQMLPEGDTVFQITSANFAASFGIEFYGHGHSEMVTLKAISAIPYSQIVTSNNLANPLNSAALNGMSMLTAIDWYVGNVPVTETKGIVAGRALMDKSTTNLFAANLTAINSQPTNENMSWSAQVLISSSNTQTEEIEYPISFWATNSYISKEGPYITYDDITGFPKYYGFFASSIRATGNPFNTPLKSNIKVLTYPLYNNAYLESNYMTNLQEGAVPISTSLPLDFTSLPFINTVTLTPYTTGFLKEWYVQTEWQLSADTQMEIGSWFYNTQKLPSDTEFDWKTVNLSTLNSTSTPVTGYAFRLSYDQNTNEVYLPMWTASPIVDTKLKLDVNAYKIVMLSATMGDDFIKRGRIVSTHVDYLTAGSIVFTVDPIVNGQINGTEVTIYPAISANKVSGTKTYGTTLEFIDTFNPDQPTSEASVGNVNFKLSGSQKHWWWKDWERSLMYVPMSVEASVKQIPYTNIYMPNYFSLKDEFATISLGIWHPDVDSVTISSPGYSNDVITINTEEKPDFAALNPILQGQMRFNKIGKAPLKVDVLVNQTIGDITTKEIVTINLPDMTEVVVAYDEHVDEKFFKQNLSEFKLTYNEEPRISPNEWATSDNVNSIVEKFYQTLDEINSFTKSFTKKNQLYAWFGLSATPDFIPPLVWEDHECGEEYANVEEDRTPNLTWEATTNMSPLSGRYTWTFNNCSDKYDPSCKGKWCVAWKWEKRKSGSSPIDISWNDTRAYGPYAKRWLFERCDDIMDVRSCEKDTWKVFTIDEEAFPIYYARNIERCRFVTCRSFPTTHFMVTVYPTEINLQLNDYVASKIDTVYDIDGYLTYENIVAMHCIDEDTIAVLDQSIPRITVYRINKYKRILEQLFSWGSYGIRSSGAGFNKPTDIHVDQTSSVWVCDAGNRCVKKHTLRGKPLLTITHEKFDNSTPTSICVDSKLNLHVLLDNEIAVFDKGGEYLYSYTWPQHITKVNRIASSYNREMIYTSWDKGVSKFFRTGVFAFDAVINIQCLDETFLSNFTNMIQDECRNLFVTVGDKMLKIPDLQKVNETKASLSKNFWSIQDLMIDGEEFIQPWVYIKVFHRLWDNIEIMRNSLCYDAYGCKSYISPTHAKEDLIIGQNEIVTNAVINRLSEQLWDNLASVIKYFDPLCKN